MMHPDTAQNSTPCAYCGKPTRLLWFPERGQPVRACSASHAMEALRERQERARLRGRKGAAAGGASE